MPVSSDLSSFKTNLSDVVRPNRFKIIFPNLNPNGGGFIGDGVVTQAFIKSVTLPGRNMGEIPLHWQGMTFKIGGDITYDDITVAFINDENYAARMAVANWFNLIMETTADNTLRPQNQRAGASNYRHDVIITQLGRSGGDADILKQITLFDAWPKSMDGLELSMDSLDSLSEFSVTLCYNYWGYRKKNS